LERSSRPWYQYVDLRKIPEDKLTIEQRERLRDLKL
jgi:hypothetical protein